MQCFSTIAQPVLHAGTCLAHASACGTGNWLGEGMACLGRVHSQVRLQTVAHYVLCAGASYEYLCRPGVTSFMLSAAAPLFMTGTQFLLQNLLARLVLRTGLARRSAAAQELEWKQYVREGAGRSVERSAACFSAPSFGMAVQRSVHACPLHTSLLAHRANQPGHLTSCSSAEVTSASLLASHDCNCSNSLMLPMLCPCCSAAQWRVNRA